MSQSTVKFNVGGKHFEVARALIDDHSDTLLGKLVSDTWNANQNKNREIFSLAWKCHNMMCQGMLDGDDDDGCYSVTIGREHKLFKTANSVDGDEDEEKKLLKVYLKSYFGLMLLSIQWRCEGRRCSRGSFRGDILFKVRAAKRGRSREIFLLLGNVIT